MWYTYTMEYHSSIKKNEIMPFGTTWMNLKIIILSEIRQISYAIAYMWNLKIQVNLHINRNRSTKARKQAYGYQRKGRGMDTLCLGLIHNTLLYKIGNPHGPSV